MKVERESERPKLSRDNRKEGIAGRDRPDEEAAGSAFSADLSKLYF